MNTWVHQLLPPPLNNPHFEIWRQTGSRTCACVLAYNQFNRLVPELLCWKHQQNNNKNCGNTMRLLQCMTSHQPTQNQLAAFPVRPPTQWLLCKSMVNGLFDTSHADGEDWNQTDNLLVGGWPLYHLNPSRPSELTDMNMLYPMSWLPSRRRTTHLFSNLTYWS